MPQPIDPNQPDDLAQGSDASAVEVPASTFYHPDEGDVMFRPLQPSRWNESTTFLRGVGLGTAAFALYSIGRIIDDIRHARGR